MRFFESWWEHVPTIVRCAPLIMAVLAAVFHHPSGPQGYGWE
jgi:hypothetical protein